MMRARWLSGLWAIAACASPLHEPTPIATLAPGRGAGRSADALLAEANAAWALRAQPGKAKLAQDLYLDAAKADERRVESLLGAMRAISYRIEYEKDVDKGALARTGVDLGQWCQRRPPVAPECDYRFALALGQQARLQPSTGLKALDRMVELLKRAIAAAPRLDAAGPHRVLALVLLRAPGWPLGPGDPETALNEARMAARIAPEAAQNHIVLGEALAANGQRALARSAYERAVQLAAKARAAGDPEGAGWVAQAQAGLAETGRH